MSKQKFYSNQDKLIFHFLQNYQMYSLLMREKQEEYKNIY